MITRYQLRGLLNDIANNVLFNYLNLHAYHGTLRLTTHDMRMHELDPPRSTQQA